MTFDFSKFYPVLKLAGSATVSAAVPALIGVLAGFDWTQVGVPAVVAGLIGPLLHAMPSPFKA